MDVVSYKCPNCGGELKFDPASGKYTCEWCRSAFAQEEADAQTAKKQADSNQQNTSAKEDNDDEGQVYTCPSCGATIVTDSTTAATFCYYCHNPVVLSGRLSGDEKPDYVLPFKIDRKKALEIFEQWIKNHKFVPKAFYSKDQIDKFTGVYFPYYMYSCKVNGKLNIEADKVNVYTRGNIEYTETETYKVERDGDMDINNIFRNALGKANKVLADCVQPFTAEDMKPFNMSYLTGFMAEKKDIESKQFDGEIDEEIKNYAVASLTDSLSQYENVHITSDSLKLSDKKCEYALLPVWTLTYQSGGKTYYFSINGQSGKTVGELPIDMKKLILSTLLFFVPAVIVLLAVFYFFL